MMPVASSSCSFAQLGGGGSASRACEAAGGFEGAAPIGPVRGRVARIQMDCMIQLYDLVANILGNNPSISSLYRYVYCIYSQ